MMLPRLKEGHGIQTPGTPAFTPRHNVLNLISQSIDAQSGAERGHSIPDLFSQTMQFEFDLSVRNPRAVETWQGMIAAILLADSGAMRVRAIAFAQLVNSPFVQILKDTGSRRGIDSITLFEARQKDGTYSAIAFRFADMPTMICPAAQLSGSYDIHVPWIVNGAAGCTFVSPRALVSVDNLRDQGVALRNEIYALSQRSIPASENKDGLQLALLNEFFKSLDALGDDISEYPVNERARDVLFTIEPSARTRPSAVFTDKICLFKESARSVGDGKEEDAQGSTAQTEGAEYNTCRARLKDSMEIIGSGINSWRALIPIRASYARPLEKEFLAGNLRVSMRFRYGSIEVNLLGRNNESLEFKRYRMQDILNLTNTRPAAQVAVWPGAKLAGWKRYYLLQNIEAQMLPIVASTLDGQGGGAEVCLLDGMPDCLTFSLFNVEVGLLFPKYETVVNKQLREINVGFDFGTTGTTVYKYDPSIGIASPMSFAKDGSLFVFGREEASEYAFTSLFVPENIADRATHYSLLRRKAEPLSEGHSLIQTAIPFILQNGHKPHNAEYCATQGRHISDLLRDVSDDLKWSAVGSDKLRAHLFLEQYFMMCLWNAAVSNASYVHWRVSYPLAMTLKQQGDFTSKVRSIIAGLCAGCYKTLFDVNFCSESEAVGFMLMDNNIQVKYLEGLVVNDESGFFCIDIGGGTTDYSIWKNRRLIIQSSLKWAGNAILCDTVTRENHGHAPRRNLPDSFFRGGADGENKAALTEALEAGRPDEFRRVWNVLADDISDSIKGLHRTETPLLNYMNIIRFNLYLIFYFAGRMAREAVLGLKPDGSEESILVLGAKGQPLPVALLGNGAKMLNMLYDDVEFSGSAKGAEGSFARRERRNLSVCEEEKGRLLRAFKVGCGKVDIEAVIVEPFMPKQETARGLALAPEAFLLQRANTIATDATTNDWPQRCAYEIDDDGVVYQTMTEGFRELIEESFLALREALDGDDELREFLGTLFDPPTGTDKYSLEAYYRLIWLTGMRQNPEPTLPGQPLPPRNTNAGRFVEILSLMNRIMRTAE
jgi:hypothetical protein